MWYNSLNIYKTKRAKIKIPYIYIYTRGAYDKFSDFFSYGHLKLS